MCLKTESAANGTVEVPVKAPGTAVKLADSAPTEDDSGVKGSSAPPANADAAAEANGTPSSSKKPQNGKRKSTSGVPEHKTKKLNKKKSLPKITHLDAQPGEYYFARLKSYPPWPAIICDEGMLPHSLLSTRPVTTKQADGTYKEAYADDGKRVHERTFPIMFLHTNEL
jgi:PWWP domain